MFQCLAIGALKRPHLRQYLDGLIRLMRLDGLITLRVTDIQIQLVLRLKGDLTIEIHIALVHLVILKQTGDDLRRQ